MCLCLWLGADMYILWCLNLWWEGVITFVAPAAPPAKGCWLPVAGPFCATATELPTTTSVATIARLLRVFIMLLPDAEARIAAGAHRNAFVRSSVPSERENR